MCVCVCVRMYLLHLAVLFRIFFWILWQVFDFIIPLGLQLVSIMSDGGGGGLYDCVGG